MLTVVFLDVRLLEILRVIDVVKDSTEGLEAIGIVCKLRSASCIDNVPCIYYGISYFLPVLAQELGLLVVDYPWGVECLQLLGFFGFAAPTVVDDDGLRGYDLLEVSPLQLPWTGCHEVRTWYFVSRVAQQHVWRGVWRAPSAGFVASA